MSPCLLVSLSGIRRRLLAWFERNQRDLPWRRDRDPFHIWVSEVMLQQTQVATVIPYYEQFLKRFPSLAALAGAEEEEVLRAWEGLGYYSRARNMHKAARIIMSDHGGEFPTDPEVVRSLPGMGRYTVGAVLSQAFDFRLPILEANSQRVLCRLFGQDGDPRRNPLRSHLWEIAERMLPRRGSGQLNQALMELGALVCTSGKPRCDDCPIADHCAARRLGVQADIPRRANGRRATLVDENAVIIRRGSRVLIAQRPQGGRWAGMWEFPHGEIESGESPADGVIRLTRSLGLRVKDVHPFLTVRHSVTRFRITIACFEARYLSGGFSSDFYLQGRWLKPEELHDFPLSAPQRRIARKIGRTVPYRNVTPRRKPAPLPTKR